MDLAIQAGQYLVNHDMFWGLGFGTVLAFPQMAKYIEPIFCPAKPGGHDIRSYFSSPDGLGMIIGRPPTTVTISMTATETATTTVQGPTNKPSTKWTTTMKEKTSWRTKTKTDTVPSLVTTTVLKLTTLLETTTTTEHHTNTEYSRTLMLTTPHTTTSWLPKTTVTRTEWQRLTVIEFGIARPAVQTVYSDWRAPIIPFSTKFFERVLGSAIVLFLLGVSLFLAALVFGLSKRLRNWNSEEWYQHYKAKMRKSIDDKNLAEEERNNTQRDLARAKKELITRKIQYIANNEDRKKRDTALQRLRDTIVELEQMPPTLVPGFCWQNLESDTNFPATLDLWKRTRASHEKKLRKQIFKERNITLESEELCKDKIKEFEKIIRNGRDEAEETGSWEPALRKRIEELKVEIFVCKASEKRLRGFFEVLRASQGTRDDIIKARDETIEALRAEIARRNQLDDTNQ
ncbi:hypothetical protein EK21DRAFT_110708 [Setomelanomma holmii]|uniref:Uncharacterized protein n=1 Tax=Setomelanomma holmii TaxID=210430 RepID=A0A9P4HC77_9PLEO|nr:hypothetical protein EK21DRAFT_110708 [Setomelanomma holmii]